MFFQPLRFCRTPASSSQLRSRHSDFRHTCIPSGDCSKVSAFSNRMPTILCVAKYGAASLSIASAARTPKATLETHLRVATRQTSRRAQYALRRPDVGCSRRVMACGNVFGTQRNVTSWQDHGCKPGGVMQQQTPLAHASPVPSPGGAHEQ